MIAALVLCALLVVLVAFQLALALGAPLGHFAWGGRHRVLPTRFRIGSVVAIPIYACIALIALDRSGVVDAVPDPFSAVGMWVVVAYLVFGIGLNALSRSLPERYTFVPVTTVLAGLSLLVAMGVGVAG